MNDPIPAPNLSNTIRRLLIIRQSALGDLVNALYVLRPIRKTLPDAHVGWLVDDRFRDLFDAVEGVDGVIPYPRRLWGGWLARPWQWPRLVLDWRRHGRALRDGRFDFVFDLQGNEKSLLSLRAMRAPAGIRYDGGTGPALRADQFLDLLRRAGIGGTRDIVPWRIPEEAERTVAGFLESSGLDRVSWAAIHPGSSGFGAYKRWPVSRFVQLASRLSDASIPVLVVWGPGERALAERVVSEAGSGGAGVRLAPETKPLPVLLALLKRAGVFVGNDSGPLHAASACGTPTVGLYGPKDPTRYAPASPPRAILYHPLPCSPCGSRRCNNPECMTALAVDTVLETTQTLLRDRVDRPFRGTPQRGPDRPTCAPSGPRLPVDAPAPGPGPNRFFEAGSWQWTVRAEEAGPLADAAMRSAAGLPGTTVAGNPRRRFLRLRLPRFQPDGSATETGGRPVFVKVYAHRTTVQRLRSRIGRSQADVEFDRLSHLHAAGAPVPTPIALGRGPDEEAVILEDLGDIPTVRDRFERNPAEGERRPLLRGLADAVVALHGAGFVHEDLHAGNLLVLPSGDIRVVDVQRGHRIMAPGIPDRALTLAHLLFSLVSFTRTAERLRLLRRYADRLDLKPPARRTLRDAVSLALGRLRRRYVLRQMQRARRGGSRIWIGPWKGGRARSSTDARKDLDKPETVQTTVKDEAGRRILKVSKGDRTLAIKEETHRRRGALEWIGAHGWRAAGLPAPRPVFLIEPPSGPVRLATEWLEGASPVNAWVEERLRRGAPPSWRRDLAWRLGRFARRIHDTGIYHADLKAGNVLAREEEGRGPTFSVLDLDRIAVHANAVPRGQALANLAQLNAAFAPPVTRADRLRCFFAYAARDRELRRAWKGVVREVMRLTVARRHRWP